jgi:hypothetical protein
MQVRGGPAHNDYGDGYSMEDGETVLQHARGEGDMSKLSEKKRLYLQKKTRGLTADENPSIRERIQRDPKLDVHDLVKVIGCVPVQIAGVNSAVTK